MFDQRQIGELKEAFSLIDQNADGIIDRDDLQEILTSFGKIPKPEELDSMMADIPGESPLNFTLFLAMMGERMQGTDSEAELLQAFEVLDSKRTGCISIGLLREYLTGMGDKLSDDEFELMLKGVELDSRGHLDYRQFVKILTGAQNEDE